MDCFPEAHNAVVTSAIFAPNPGLMVSLDTSEKQETESKGEDSETSDTIPSGRCLRWALLNTMVWGGKDYEEYFQFGRRVYWEEKSLQGHGYIFLP